MPTDLISILLKIFAPIGVAIGIYFYGHHNGYEEYHQKAMAELAKAQQVEIKHAEVQTIVNDRVITKYVDRLVEVNKATPQLIEDIKKDLKNENVSCSLPIGTIRVYDDSNRNKDAAGTSGAIGSPK
jgi:hypothetical protein